MKDRAPHPAFAAQDDHQRPEDFCHACGEVYCHRYLISGYCEPCAVVRGLPPLPRHTHRPVRDRAVLALTDLAEQVRLARHQFGGKVPEPLWGQYLEAMRAAPRPGAAG